MESADSSLANVPRSIALHKTVHKTLVAKLLSTIGPSEESPAVLVRLQLDNPRTLERCSNETHYLVQKKSRSICPVRSRYSSCFRRVKVLNWKTSSVISIRSNSSRSCCAPRRTSH